MTPHCWLFVCNFYDKKATSCLARMYFIMFNDERGLEVSEQVDNDFSPSEMTHKSMYFLQLCTKRKDMLVLA